jgi:hypothetical protein
MKSRPSLVSSIAWIVQMSLVLESGSRLSLVDEPRLGRLVAGEFWRKELEGNRASESDVLGLVDHTHPSAAEFFEDPVTRYGLTDHLVPL